MNILLPDQIQAFVERQARAAGFESTEAYVYHLILKEEQRIAQQERVESLLLEGVDSGEPVEVTDDWWEHKRSRLAEGFRQAGAVHTRSRTCD